MRFLTVLIIIAGLVCGWIILREKRDKVNLSGWAKQLATYLEPQAKGTPKPGSTWEADEATFFKTLYFLQLVEKEKLDVDATVGQALEHLNITGDKASIVKDSVVDNYAAAKRLKVFDDTANLIRLEQGEPAFIKLEGWDGEPIALRQFVPPSEAPEVANVLPNFMLLPGAVRDFESNLPASASPERVRSLERAGYITKGTVDRLLGGKKSR